MGTTSGRLLNQPLTKMSLLRVGVGLVFVGIAMAQQMALRGLDLAYPAVPTTTAAPHYPPHWVGTHDKNEAIFAFCSLFFVPCLVLSCVVVMKRKLPDQCCAGCCCCGD